MRYSYKVVWGFIRGGKNIEFAFARGHGNEAIVFIERDDTAGFAFGHRYAV